MVKNPPAMQETQFDCRVGKIRWRRDRLPTPIFLGFPGGSAGKESAYNVGDLGNLGLIPGLGRSPGEGKGYPLQYSGLETSMDSPWGRQESDTTERLHFHFLLSCTGKGHGNPLYCSCLENPRDGEPGRLPSWGRTESDMTEAI